MKQLRIAFDTSPLSTGHAVRGVGAYTNRLVSALKDTRILGYEDIRIDAFDFKTNHQSPFGKLRVMLSKAEASLITNHYDILHYPYFDLFFLTLPLNKPIETIVTIHDVIPLIYPEHYPKGLRGWLKLQIQKLSLKNVSAIITDSETSKKDIVRFLDVPQEKIFTVHLAAGNEFKKLKDDPWRIQMKKKYKLPEQFILYVGDVNYNKNVLSLVRACKSIHIPLVIVGKQAIQKDFDRLHPENQQLFQLIKYYGEDPDVLRIGYVPAEDLVKIYNLATVYCQPSFYEGFGLPVIEAMACGTPVVLARTQALVEIADKVALFVDPGDIKSVADGLLTVIKDQSVRNRLVRDGMKAAKEFSWEKTAKQTIEVYMKVAHA